MAVSIYLDNCVLGRPDDEGGHRIKMQAVAVNEILAGVKAGRWGLLCSDVHMEEVEQIRDTYPQRYTNVMARLNLAAAETLDSSEALALYDVFRKAPRGRAPLLKPKDGLHLASAVLARATVMLTVDRKLYLWARAHRHLLKGTLVLRPGEFLERFRDARISEETGE